MLGNSIVVLVTILAAVLLFSRKLQTCVALSVAHEMRNLANRNAKMALFAAVAFFCLCVVLLGIPSGS